MSILENTISMMEALPEADLIKIQNFITKLFHNRECDTAAGRLLKPMSRKDFLNDVEAAEKEIADGKFKKAEKVFDGLEQRYGF